MKSSFQTTVIVIFCVAFVAAIAVFSGIFSSNSQKASTEPQGLVTVWGILPQDMVQRYIEQFNSRGLGYNLQYFEHSPVTFSNDLVNALADGVQPDILIFSSELISQFRNKLYPIPYELYSERSFRDGYIDGAQIFLAQEGVLAVPLVVDPLVVYYNKDILSSENFIIPPATWSDVVQSTQRLTKFDARNGILQSTIALGEGENINHFRDILSALFLQTGNPIIRYNTVTDQYSASLNTKTNPEIIGLPTADVLSYFISFTNPTSNSYSWNRSLPNNLDMFLAGNLAFYIGRASELFTIQKLNPNLNFDVIELFKPDTSVRPVTFGSFIGASMLKNAPNPTAAYAALSEFTQDAAVDDLSKRLTLPPTKRSLLLVQQKNPYVSVFFKAALSSFAWPDPNSVVTDRIFRDMITNVTSGKTNAESAINEANYNLQDNIR